mmetsp:Transcript_11038/g.18018  ORF Transcript_11038/g.18018 Transcript_11038/m.18018 type:complete len:400 (+) Transcript_11038:91-1290(+)
MSSRPSRKRTTTQRFNFEQNVKSEPRDEDEEEDQEEDDGDRRPRQRTRGRRGGSDIRAPPSSSSSLASIPASQTLRDDNQNGDVLTFSPYRQVADSVQREMKIPDIALTARQIDMWGKLSESQQSQIVKVVSRLLLFKGTTNDKVTPSHVKDVLAKINQSYQIHSQVALREAQKFLKDTFGYNVETVRVQPERNAKQTKDAVSAIFVVNDVRSSVLQKILSQQTHSLADPLLAGYKAFCHVVFMSIWTAPGRAIDMQQLLRNVRKVDPRFPEALPNSTGKQSARTSSGIDELAGLGFPALVQRMAKEGYVKETKDASDSSIGRRSISFGPRFFVEVGLKQLAKSYFLALRVPVDDSVMDDVDRERKGYISGNVDQELQEEEEEEEDGENGGHEEHKGPR